MHVRTIESLPWTNSSSEKIQWEIQQQVDERGFYLYEWITPDELRMSIQADYLAIIKYSSIPLAIVTLIGGFIGLAWGMAWVLLTVFGVLAIFYTIVFCALLVKMTRKSYLYARGANVIVTDNHYVSGWKILKKTDFNGQKEAFEKMERIFREPLFEESQLKDYIEFEKKNLFSQLKDIAIWGWKMIRWLSESRNAWPIIMVLLISWVLYGGMMTLVYLLWVFFVTLFARVFSWFADKALLATNNTEHTIQNLFAKVNIASIVLKKEQKNSISLLTEAWRNEWAESLSSRLRESFEIISKNAEFATEKSLELRKKLEESQYRELFNFSKYGNWIKTQVIAPIREISELLEKNKHTLEDTLTHIESQISTVSDVSFRRPLELQRERIISELNNFDRMIEILRGYEEKLYV